jgi:hypothetical protein
MKMQRILSMVYVIAAAQGFSQLAFAQSADISAAEVSICDPFLDNNLSEYEDDGDEDVTQSRIYRYDLEKSETLQSEPAIMEALYEEKWDLATGDEIPRNELCQSEPSYVVNWAELTGEDEQGAMAVLARGMFQFKKDGTFEYVYSKRPYVGTWAVTDLQMTLQADWLNSGAPIVAPVERVETPVEVNYSDGSKDVYTEEVHRVGVFRFLRIDTTAKGKIQICACTSN